MQKGEKTVLHWQLQQHSLDILQEVVYRVPLTPTLYECNIQYGSSLLILPLLKILNSQRSEDLNSPAQGSQHTDSSLVSNTMNFVIFFHPKTLMHLKLHLKTRYHYSFDRNMHRILASYALLSRLTQFLPQTKWPRVLCLPHLLLSGGA